MKQASDGLIQVVREDLEYLIKGWPSGEVSDDEIRRSSTVLRRLLTYKDLIKVWTTVVGTKNFLVDSSNIEIMDSKRLNEIEFASSLKAVQGSGMTIFSATVYNRIQQGPGPIKISGSKQVLLKKFIFQTVAIINGTKVTRNDLVQYVANKMGGAHYDDGRQKPHDNALAAIEQYQLGNRSAFTHYMLSCGQSLASSESTKELLERLS